MDPLPDCRIGRLRKPKDGSGVNENLASFGIIKTGLATGQPRMRVFMA